jgi:hypothetical protein
LITIAAVVIFLLPVRPINASILIELYSKILTPLNKKSLIMGRKEKRDSISKEKTKKAKTTLRLIFSFLEKRKAEINK